ncbi:MAG: hypothetical protein WBH68_03955 [Erysipelotrichaceae bacterium]
MDKLKNYMITFMRGRYGGDHLNSALIIIGFSFLIINVFLNNSALSILVNIIMLYALYRGFSKNIWARQKENMRFLEITKDLRCNFKLIKYNFTDKESKYFICPNCKQMVKVPRGKGKIEIRCPRCNTKFDRKS